MSGKNATQAPASLPLRVPPLLGFNVPYDYDKETGFRVGCIPDVQIEKIIKPHWKKLSKDFSAEGAEIFLGVLLRKYLSTGFPPEKKDLDVFQVLLCCLRLSRRGGSKLSWQGRGRVMIPVPDISHFDPSLDYACREFVASVTDPPQGGAGGTLVTGVGPGVGTEVTIANGAGPGITSTRELAERLEVLHNWATIEHQDILFKKLKDSSISNAERLGEMLSILGWFLSIFLTLLAPLFLTAMFTFLNALVGSKVNEIMEPSSLEKTNTSDMPVVEVAEPLALQAIGLTGSAALAGGLLSVIGNGGRADWYGYENYGNIVQLVTGLDYRGAGVLVGTVGMTISMLNIYIAEITDWKEVFEVDFYKEDWERSFALVLLFVGSFCSLITKGFHWADQLERHKFGKRAMSILMEAAESAYGRSLSSCAILAASGELSKEALSTTNSVYLPVPGLGVPEGYDLRKVFYGSLVHSQYYADKDWNPWDTPWSIGLALPGWKQGGCRIPRGVLPMKITVTPRNKDVFTVFGHRRTESHKEVKQGRSISRNICPMEETLNRVPNKELPKNDVKVWWDICPMRDTLKRVPNKDSPKYDVKWSGNS